MKKIVFATNNRHKIEEVKAMLPSSIEIVSLAEIGCRDDIPETSGTLEGNALQKARFVSEKFGVDCFADDTGLEVDALGGEPGVFSARYAGPQHDSEANMKKLLANMDDKTDRTARFRTVVALLLDGREFLFDGIAGGRIIAERRGGEGFGYDPVFVPDGYEKTFAELGADEKNRISHRAKAVKKLVDFLKTIE